MFLTIHRLYCSNLHEDGCFNPDSDGDESITGVWREAESEGWRKLRKPDGRMGHYCPACVAELKDGPTQEPT